MSFDYNTTRKKLALPEYGRNVQKMVDYVVTIEDREKRNRLAHVLIKVMGNLNPHLRDVADFTHKLWDHLAIMSNFELDIETPYPLPTLEKLQEKPRSVKYPQSRIKYKHYGKSTENMIDRAMSMEEGEKRDALIVIIANHMKKQYLTWNKDAVEDFFIFSDLKEMSDGKLDITNSDIKLVEPKEVNPTHNKTRNKKRQRKK